MRKGFIYKIVSPSGKIYIGQTIDLRSRKSHYKRLHCKSQYRLYCSLKGHGFDAHQFEIIQVCDNNKNLLNKAEIFWINYYNTFNTDHGLNSMSGGSRGVPSIETRKRQSESHKGKKLSPETCMRLSESKKGRIFSKESREKISKSHIGLKHTPESCRKMSLSNPHRREVICTKSNQIFESIKVAAKNWGCTYQTMKVWLRGELPNKSTYILLKDHIAITT